jgi:hypothetical protein
MLISSRHICTHRLTQPKANPTTIRIGASRAPERIDHRSQTTVWASLWGRSSIPGCPRLLGPVITAPTAQAPLLPPTPSAYAWLTQSSILLVLAGITSALLRYMVPCLPWANGFISSRSSRKRGVIPRLSSPAPITAKVPMVCLLPTPEAVSTAVAQPPLRMCM